MGVFEARRFDCNAVVNKTHNLGMAGNADAREPVDESFVLAEVVTPDAE